jgi:hypothetical protein
MLIGTVVLVLVVTLVVGETGTLARVAAFLAALSGFGVAAWTTFLGGGERIWEAFLDWAGVDW